jgi:hypothetical protein
VTLSRPTGPEELALVEASGWREWPPRLPGQFPALGHKVDRSRKEITWPPHGNIEL